MNNSKQSKTARCILLLAVVCGVATGALAQDKEKVLMCKTTVLAALKPLPKLRYRCPADLSDYDEKILKQANRIAAINTLKMKLQTFTSPRWWQANVDDLNLCELRRKPGIFSKKEQEKIRIGGYTFDLFGNHSLRLALLPDPCYVTDFHSSNAFLLYRQAGRVYVTQVLDGFFSRADNPV